MKILILSMEGDGAAVAHQLARDGHQVFLYIRDRKFYRTLRGIVERVESWRPHLTSADLVICDMVGFGGYAETIRKFGKPLLCCDLVTDALELNRVQAMEVLGRLGYTLPVTKCYTGPAEARTLEWTCENGYAIKPCGNLPSGQTYLCATPEIYQWALKQFTAGQALLVQEIIHGVEVSSEGWWNGTDWLHPFNHTFEEKRLMPGGIGRMTGCQGNIVFNLKQPNRLIDTVLSPLTAVLKKTSYRGPIDVNCIVTADAAYPLELTCRFGYDAFEALMFGMKGDVGAFLYDLAMGVAKSIPIHSYDYLAAIRATLPPYPDTEVDGSGYYGLPLGGLGDLSGIFFADVEKINDSYVAAGSDGCLMKVTAYGRDLRETTRRCYARLGRIKALDLQYRNDIGKRVNNDLATLRTWGWI